MFHATLAANPRTYAKRYMIFIDINVQVKCHLIINTRLIENSYIISILYIVFLDICEKR